MLVAVWWRAPLETIHQFAEDQVVGCVAAEQVRALHAHHFAGRGIDVVTLCRPLSHASGPYRSHDARALRTHHRAAAYAYDQIDQARTSLEQLR